MVSSELLRAESKRVQACCTRRALFSAESWLLGGRPCRAKRCMWGAVEQVHTASAIMSENLTSRSCFMLSSGSQLIPRAPRSISSPAATAAPRVSYDSLTGALSLRSEMLSSYWSPRMRMGIGTQSSLSLLGLQLSKRRSQAPRNTSQDVKLKMIHF